jgi:hypothetical protein
LGDNLTAYFIVFDLSLKQGRRIAVPALTIRIEHSLRRAYPPDTFHKIRKGPVSGSQHRNAEVSTFDEILQNQSCSGGKRPAAEALKGASLREILSSSVDCTNFP